MIVRTVAYLQKEWYWSFYIDLEYLFSFRTIINYIFLYGCTGTSTSTQFKFRKYIYIDQNSVDEITNGIGTNTGRLISTHMPIINSNYYLTYTSDSFRIVFSIPTYVCANKNSKYQFKIYFKRRSLVHGFHWPIGFSVYNILLYHVEASIF